MVARSIWVEPVNGDVLKIRDAIRAAYLDGMREARAMLLHSAKQLNALETTLSLCVAGALEGAADGIEERIVAEISREEAGR